VNPSLFPMGAQAMAHSCRLSLPRRLERLLLTQAQSASPQSTTHTCTRWAPLASPHTDSNQVHCLSFALSQRNDQSGKCNVVDDVDMSPLDTERPCSLSRSLFTMTMCTSQSCCMPDRQCCAICGMDFNYKVQVCMTECTTLDLKALCDSPFSCLCSIAPDRQAHQSSAGAF